MSTTAQGRTFGKALEWMWDGEKVTRKGWNNPNIWLEIQTPDENSKMTEPYIYMCKTTREPYQTETTTKRFPSTLSCESLLADDWMTLA